MTILRALFAMCCGLLLTGNAGSAPITAVASVAVGKNPTGLVVSPSNIAYVANNNQTVKGVGSVSVLDAGGKAVAATIKNLGVGTYALAMSPDGRTLYAANAGYTTAGTTVSVIDAATKRVTGTLKGFNGPNAIVITPDGKRAYVANYGFYDYHTRDTSKNVRAISVVDLKAGKITQTITVGLGPDSLALTPDGKTLYTANFYDSTISIVDTATNTVVKTISDAGFNGPYTLAMTPDGRFVYSTNYGNPITEARTAPQNTVSVIAVDGNTVVKTFSVGPAGSQPSGVAITPDGKHALVTNYDNRTLSVIDTTTYAVTDAIKVGNLPGAVAVSPNGLWAYVSNYQDNTVSVIDLRGLGAARK